MLFITLGSLRGSGAGFPAREKDRGWGGGSLSLERGWPSQELWVPGRSSDGRSSAGLARRQPNSRVILLYGQLLKYFYPGDRDRCILLVGGAKVRELVGETGMGQLSESLKSKAEKGAARLSGTGS